MISDYPPVSIPSSHFPPPQIGRFFCYTPQDRRAEPGLVILALLARPDDTGTEAPTVIALHPDIADELAVNLVRYAATVRQADPR